MTKSGPRVLLLSFLALLLTSVPARADAIIAFGFSVENTSENAQLYTFLFSLPFATGPFDTLSSEFTTTVHDLDDSGAAAVVPADASGFMMVPAIDGTNVLAAALGEGCAPIDSAGFTLTCDPFATASVGVATLANGVLSATVSFILSGGDALSGQGQLKLTGPAVPEPASLLLLGLGAGAVAARRRRSRSA